MDSAVWLRRPSHSTSSRARQHRRRLPGSGDEASKPTAAGAISCSTELKTQGQGLATTDADGGYPAALLPAPESMDQGHDDPGA